MARTAFLLGSAAALALTSQPLRAQQADEQDEQESAIPGPIQLPNATPSPTPSGGIVAIPPRGSGRSSGSAIGPDSLSDFSLGGNSPAPRPSAATPAPAPAGRAAPTPVSPPSAPGGARTVARNQQPSVTTRPSGQLTPVAPTASAPGSSDRTLAPVPVDELPDTSLIPPPSGLTVPESGVAAWPWLLALLGVIGAGLFAWRRKGAPATAGGAPVMERSAPPSEPEPAPSPPPAQPVPPPPSSPDSVAPAGLVTTAALKPDLVVDVEPVRATYSDEGFILDYRLTLANRGQGEARGVTIRQEFLFASATQASDFDEFLARPVGDVDRAIPQSIRPGTAIALDARATLPLHKARAVVIEGRQLLLPILALGVRHAAQSPAQKPQANGMWLIGRKGGSDGRMSPIRADKGPRVIRDVELKRQ